MMAAVIVTWNSEDVIGRCLDSCIRAGLREIIVVDNASSDGTVAEVRRRPAVKLVASPANLGFAGGVNLAVSGTPAPYILLLNPDVELVNGTNDLLEILNSPGTGAAAGRLTGTDGGPQHGFNVRALPTGWTLAFEALGLNRIWPTNPVNRRYRSQVTAVQPVPVEQPAGAFLAFRRDVWSELGGFDEQFWPAWFEDVDFCQRLQRNGRTVWYLPSASAKHSGGNSVRKLSWAAKERYWYTNLLRYAFKHFRLRGRLIATFGVIGGCLLRCIALTFSRFSLEPVAVYSRVVWVACLFWFSQVGAEPGQPRRTFIWKGLQLRN
jgi:GT2 family glycosyltransferase